MLRERSEKEIALGTEWSSQLPKRLIRWTIYQVVAHQNESNELGELWAVVVLRNARRTSERKARLCTHERSRQPLGSDIVNSAYNGFGFDEVRDIAKAGTFSPRIVRCFLWSWDITI